jgi:hypothetical protein
MAFLKKAQAAIVHANWGPSNWQQFMNLHRQEMVPGFARTASSSNLAMRASEILQDDFSADKYLLTHATIVASVDVSTFPGIKVGNIQENGRTIHRKWAEYRIEPQCDPFINNNHDAWSRPVLLKSYPTFVGGHNFCFVPGTKVMMADGTYRPIEEISIGDEVITHKGRVRRVTHVFEREYEGEIRSIKFDRFKDPILVTGNHPFRSIDVCAPATKIRPGTKTSNVIRYRHDQIVRALRNESHVFGEGFSAKKGWRNAEDLKEGSYVLGAERVVGTLRRFAEATLLGYYVAEGCPLGQKSGSDGFVLSFGPHEHFLALDAKRHAESLWPHARVEIRPSQTSLRVEVFASGAREWCIAMGGHLAPNKHLDASVFSWDRESLLRLLGAWMTGDGNLHKGTLRLRGSSVSRKLADQMQRIAEIAGVKSSVVFERRRINEKASTVTMVVGGEPRSFDVINRHHVHTVLVSKDSVSEVATRSARWSNLHVVASRKRSDFAWWENCRVHQVTSNTSLPYKGKVYNFEVEEDHSYVVDYGIAVHNCEHVQIEEQSKGRIIDAVARDIGPSVYVDILIATNRKHASLVQDIEQGRMSTLSMGCSVTETQCTKCGHVAADETQMCEHIKYSKGNYEFGPDGQRYRIAELCGHESLDPTGGVHFIEASWVAVPAFQGAVMRNILKPDAISITTQGQMRNILASPPPTWVSEPQEGISKAARMAFDFGEEDGGGDDEKKEKEVDPMDVLESEIEQQVLDNVKKRIKDRLKKEVQEKAVSDGELGTSTGNSIVHQGSLSKRATEYRASIGALVKVARSDVELLDNLARLNHQLGIKISRDMYLTSLRVGSTANYDTSGTYLAACSKVLGRKPTSGEAKTLVRLGQILSLRK